MGLDKSIVGGQSSQGSTSTFTEVEFMKTHLHIKVSQIAVVPYPYCLVSFVFVGHLITEKIKEAKVGEIMDIDEVRRIHCRRCGRRATSAAREMVETMVWRRMLPVRYYIDSGAPWGIGLPASPTMG
ncbi:hypothetical protein PHYPSEUDO_002309 [Phytophthora pseudosyringae]|uniref:Uncharacterized protein n=1 Tax=Phytophthora pseudosyringae TaxID=221518 RepID=A0A8T1WFY8_9STRA|nr:hypothetical protein PHYPSEUDO_002309 [Phytophthora pseudosyringae]